MASLGTVNYVNRSLNQGMKEKEMRYHNYQAICSRASYSILSAKTMSHGTGNPFDEKLSSYSSDNYL